MDISELKQRKKRLRLTTEELANKAELPVGTVSKIMTGETKNPSYQTINKLEQTIMHEEMIRRVNAYRKALDEYYRNVDEQNQMDYIEFEREYRRKNNLNDDPIPYAVERDEYREGNLAVRRDNRVTISAMADIGEDRYIELLDGHLIFGQAPNMNHQMLVQNIGKTIDKYIEENNGSCKMFNVGVNVQLDEDEYTMIIPDIVVICDDSKLTSDGIVGAPEWVVEVVSNSTRRLDYNDKMHKYMHAGVREYWIVDAERQRVTVYAGQEPMLAYVYNISDEIPVGIYDGRLNICVGKYLL